MQDKPSSLSFSVGVTLTEQKKLTKIFRLSSVLKQSLFVTQQYSITAYSPTDLLNKTQAVKILFSA